MARKKKTILLVEGDHQSLEQTRELLEKAEYEVVATTDGIDGLRQARKEQPQLVMVGLRLSGMEPNEVCQRLKADAATEDLPIIMIMTEDMLEDQMLGREADVDDYLIRPFTALELITKISPYTARDEMTGRVISTGSAELDDKMGGGIPLGSLTLIEGSSGAGKSVLSQQMMHGSLQEGYKLALFTSENTVRSLITQMQSLSLDIVHFLLLGRLRVYPIEVGHLSDGAPTALLDALRNESDRDMIFVDSLTSAVGGCSLRDILSYFEGCKRLCADGKTLLVVLHSHGLSQELTIRIRSICDAHLRLRTEEVGQRLVKTLEVTKIRGADKTTGNIVSFEVEPGWGMRIIPITKVRG